MLECYEKVKIVSFWPLFTKSKTTFDSDHDMIWAEMHFKSDTIYNDIITDGMIL